MVSASRSFVLEWSSLMCFYMVYCNRFVAASLVELVWVERAALVIWVGMVCARG